MKGDFSRSTFDPRKHYSRVLMQQGRVQLDADWNENLDILLHRIETETIDVVGECGVPVHNPAFGVVTDFSTLSQEEKDLLAELGFNTLSAGDFYLTRGRAYVDGILIENDKTLPFSQQPFVLPLGGDAITDAGTYLLYLDVWERHVTALEDPSIREVALGGPDTATRSQVIWQAMLAQVGKSDTNEIVTCTDDLHPWPDASTGTLAARTHPEDLPTDPCDIAPGAGYKRLENQLYRVEIHKGSDASSGPTFKWSRDNGSVVVAVAEFAVDGSTTKIRTNSLGHDNVLGMHENDWVEILDDATELACKPGTLVQITKIDPDNILTLSGPVTGYNIKGHPRMRRWDMDGEQTVSVPTTNDGYLKLEGGVEIKFDITGTLRSGDYWLIPARTVPGQYGDIEWPKSGINPKALLPFGIIHHYCKLAVIMAEEVDRIITITNVEDCRKRFPPLTELPAGGTCCCSVSVGENGDFPDIQSALDARPMDTNEWRICVMAGVYNLAATVSSDNVRGLVISGCGRQTHIYGPPEKPAFVFNKADTVRIENLWVEASSPSGGIFFKDSRSIEIRDNLLANRLQSDQEFGSRIPLSHEMAGRARGRIDIPAPVIVIDNGHEVTISDNNLIGLPAVHASGNNLFVLRNQIMGGGIQIVPPANEVRIADNTIVRGLGPGIQLGGGEKDITDFLHGNETLEVDRSGAAVDMESKSRNPLAGIRIVTISRNLIWGMQGSGIVTALVLSDLLHLSDVETLTISHNQIIACCQKPDVILSEKTRVGGGVVLVSAFGVQINDNFIASNGSDNIPACGIFLLDGSDIDIDDNMIVENGTIKQNPEPDSYQAGIAVQFVFGNDLGIGQTDDGKNGYPALRVRGNEVICPAGQALTIQAVGGVVVDGNTLVTRERLKQPMQPFDFRTKGACIAILDLGLPIWLPDIALLLQLMSTRKTNLHLEDSKLEERFADFPDGRVLFHNNQVTFNTDIKEDVESQGELNAGWPLRVWNEIAFAALFTSLDDISLNANQFQASVPAYGLDGIKLDQQKKLSLADFLTYALKFIHVGSGAMSIRASNNAFIERWFSNSVSYASNASMMNITTGNEATHSLVTFAPKKVQDHNLSLTS